jgi:peroxiredoxin/predicted 2-oxoglutarate/Fe(II)-dependent dioxygenase YbiX
VNGRFLPGDAVPWFKARTARNARYSFDTVAGRHVLLLFFGSARSQAAARALRAVRAHRALFDDSHACLFGVSTDPDDERAGRIADSLPGIRFFHDHDEAVSRLYGRIGADGGYEPLCLLLDPGLRVIASSPIEGIDAMLRRLAELPPPADLPAPVLLLPRVLEPGLCRALIDHYRARGGEDSGFMREIDGKTVGLIDHSHKRRQDCLIDDEALRSALRTRIQTRLVPAIEKAFQFRATHVERYIVACYDADSGGYFRPHRNNTTKGTAHRRFAVTINLNAEDYDGGDLRFPEFGPRLYRAPTGGAVVFSCSLLHEATPVARGTRYATLPFLYDEAGERVRQENLKFVA